MPLAFGARLELEPHDATPTYSSAAHTVSTARAELAPATRAAQRLRGWDRCDGSDRDPIGDRHRDTGARDLLFHHRRQRDPERQDRRDGDDGHHLLQHGWRPEDRLAGSGSAAGFARVYDVQLRLS